MTHTKIKTISKLYPLTLFIIDTNTTIININNIDYIEKKDIYKITKLNPIQIKNILNNTSSLRRCLINNTLRTIKMKKEKRNYILYSLEDIKKINDFNNTKNTLRI
jgi:hypothetical protein